MKRKRSDWWMHYDLHEYVSRKCENYPNSFYRAANVLELLLAKGYDAKWSFGTLLGLHRDGQLIPHDSDVDINIYLDEHTSFKPIKELLEANGFKCILTDTNQIVFYIDDSVIIDVCLFEKQKDGSYLCCHQVKNFVLSEKAYENTEVFLEEIYGDWKTPIGKGEKYLNGEGSR